MKTGTDSKAKFLKLQRRLNLTKWQTVGLLESLWHATARDAPCGDIGRLTNEEIAAIIDWREDEDSLIEALIATGWLDESEQYRLVVHGWSKHAPNFVRASNARWGRRFVNDSYEASYEEAPIGSSSKEASCETYTQPNQTKPNQTKPNPTRPNPTKPSVRGGDTFVGEGLTEDERRDAVRLAQRIATVLPSIRGDPIAAESISDVAIRCVRGDVARAVVESAMESVRHNRPKKPVAYFLKCINNGC